MSLPKDPSADATAAFLREGYTFISKRCAAFGSVGFHTRIGLRKVTCLSGREASEAFYHPGRFTREGAVPPTAVTLLQDKGSVQSLDGDAHHHRKALWMRMVAAPGAVAGLSAAFTHHWNEWAESRFTEECVLHAEVRRILTAAALDWTGLGDTDLDARTQEFGAMIDGAGSIGFDQAKGQLLRQRSEAWARDIMKDAFADAAAFPEGSAPRLIAGYREDGEPLSLKHAGVELINVLRPVVAIARFIVFAALSLHQRPEWRERLLGEPALVTPFVTEVRRLAPFFPAIGGIVREPFSFAGERFEEGDWVLLDLYGSSRDPGVFAEPEAFDPSRFEGRAPGPYDMAPQGAGPYETTHRCPGEKATVALVEEAVRLLLQLPYEVPQQDLTVDLGKLPALPESGFIIAPSGRP